MKMMTKSNHEVTTDANDDKQKVESADVMTLRDTINSDENIEYNSTNTVSLTGYSVTQTTEIEPDTGTTSLTGGTSEARETGTELLTEYTESSSTRAANQNGGTGAEKMPQIDVTLEDRDVSTAGKISVTGANGNTTNGSE